MKFKFKILTYEHYYNIKEEDFEQALSYNYLHPEHIVSQDDFIKGSFEETIIEDVSCIPIGKIEKYMQRLYELTSIEDGKLIVFGTNARSVLREFNNYNISIPKLNDLLYPHFLGIYTLDYIENIMKDCGYKIISKTFPENMKFMIEGVKN